MREVTGNLSGLKPSELKALERIYRRRVPPHELVSAELATFMCDLSREIGRQVGALISRRGDIEHVAVGDASRIMLPAVGRVRAGHGRFAGCVWCTPICATSLSHATIWLTWPCCVWI